MRGYSDIDQGILEDEIGSEQDYADLGKFMGDLLTSRHYRWVSHKAQVYEMLEGLVPSVSTDAQLHKENLESILRHSQALVIGDEDPESP